MHRICLFKPKIGLIPSFVYHRFVQQTTKRKISTTSTTTNW